MIKPTSHAGSQTTVTVVQYDDQVTMVVAGAINFNNVARLRSQGKNLLERATHSLINLDLQGVEHSDNAGLVLLVTWVQDAHRLNKTLNFQNVPHSLQRMTQVFGLQSILFKQ